MIKIDSKTINHNIVESYHILNVHLLILSFSTSTSSLIFRREFIADCRFRIFLSFFLISEEVNANTEPFDEVGDISVPELLKLDDRLRLTTFLT